MTLTKALKLHLRVLTIRGKTLRLVTLRPQNQVRLSTNDFHDTWHILVGSDGAALFGRLLWGLAFQRQPGTVLLIDEAHLVPTPFEADPPDPILVIPDGLTSIDDDLLRALKLRLRRSPGPPTTIRWHTFGMRAALDDTERVSQRWVLRHEPSERTRWHRERMARRAGFVCFTASAPRLRDHALEIYGMGREHHEMAAHCDNTRYGYDGEVQVISDFATKVSAARVARAEVAPQARGLILEEDLRTQIYDRADQTLARLRAARQRHTP